MRASTSLRPSGIVPVGTMAKWSLTLELSKTRLPARSTQPWDSASLAKLPAAWPEPSEDRTSLAVAT